MNSLKRTHRFKASVAFLTCLLIFTFPSCQKDELNQDSMPDMSPLVSSNKVKTTGKIKDVDGNWYKTVKIGEQRWMAENLKTTRYSNGDLIGTTDPVDLDLSTVGGNIKYQWPAGGEESYVAVYGRYYTYSTITDDRKICPKGWRIPTDDEWTTLTNYIGGESYGGKLKSTGTIEGLDGLWYYPNTGATNETGFTALPSGYRFFDGTFFDIGLYGYWWSSTVSDYAYEYAYYKQLHSGNADFIKGSFDMRYGLSVRCIRDK